MSDFESLNRKDNIYYRGSHGHMAKEIMSLAVGPLRSVATYIVNNDLDISGANQKEAVSFFTKAIAGDTGHIHIPDLKFSDQLDILLKIPGLVQNTFTVFEHVLYEPEAQINSPRTSRLLESISSDPRIAILYAYGIDPDEWIDLKQVKFWRGTPNFNTFVAMVPSNAKIVESEKMLDMISKIAGPDTMTRDEAARRIKRDSEELLSEAVHPNKLIDLPNFDEKNPIDSLNTAADVLRAGGVAL